MSLEKQTKGHLRSLAEAFAKATGMARSTISRKAFRDPGLLDRIVRRKRGSFTVRTYDRGVAWFSANWPAGLGWPDEVPRPEQEPGRPKGSEGASAPTMGG
jgi:hypothetical protein